MSTGIFLISAFVVVSFPLTVCAVLLAWVRLGNVSEQEVIVTRSTPTRRRKRERRMVANMTVIQSGMGRGGRLGGFQLREMSETDAGTTECRVLAYDEAGGYATEYWTLFHN